LRYKKLSLNTLEALKAPLPEKDNVDMYNIDNDFGRTIMLYNIVGYYASYKR
jgi:hypothetical protein